MTDQGAEPTAGSAAEGAAPTAGAVAAAVQTGTQLTVSRGMADWLRRHHTSFAFTSYQTGQLFLVGLLANGTVSFNQQNFVRAMGLCYQPGRLYLGALSQVWRLENMLRPGERANGQFDLALVPRNAQTVGDVDIHEVGTDADGRVIFVNTKYSCLATLDLVHSFRPIWKPPFISRLAPEDRCHLNGVAFDGGKPRYVTAVSRSDIVTGWRERRHEGGVLVDVETGRIVTDQLSMPHSPRLHDGSAYVLDSGRGEIVRVDLESGEKTTIAFCPGFLRGMSIHNGHALVTVSKPRNGTFAGLALDDALRGRDAEPWCGVLVVDLASGDIVEWLKLEGFITELFDVAVMPGVTCPMAIGPDTAEIRSTITFDPLLQQ
ncbi:TIGR03032 family protein [Sphingomonas palmae]|uniref:TIGR03032 family protein n=1 Tax=Sphingomonas palmae TaxID=1855283 RepID=A0A1H7UVX2_9SPHN|nr:TIGR03032 family protein [Sphingomonas palmae]SEM00825.1 TIGR03032 family protein [Sphingomonas palmae]